MALHPIKIEGVIADPAETICVTRWMAQPGARIKQGEVLAIVETAKADLEVEAPRAGWLASINVSEGGRALIGATLGALADDEGEARAAVTHAHERNLGLEPREAAPAPSPSRDVVPPAPETTPRQSQQEERIIASPRARRAAAKSGVDLVGLAGSGAGGRIVERDVLIASPAPMLSSSQRRAPIVLLHGFGADRSLWRQIIPLLGDVEIIALELPGHGAEASSPLFSIDDIAFRLSDQLEAKGIELAHFVGHSLGGAAALALTDLGRVAVRSLTLIAPAGLGAEIDAAFIELIARARSIADWERVIADMVADPAALPAGYAKAAARGRSDDSAALPAMAEALFPAGRQGFEATPALRRVNAPTRLIWGAQDRVIPARHAQAAPGFVAAHRLEGVGHVPPIEAPALLARLILETVRSAK